MPCLPQDLGAVRKEWEGQSHPSTGTAGRVASFSSYYRQCQPVPCSKNILYCISLQFLVLSELPFLPKYNVQPHGQSLRWFLGEQGAHSSPDVTIIAQEWGPLVGQRGHPAGSLGGAGLPVLHPERGEHLTPNCSSRYTSPAFFLQH